MALDRRIVSILYFNGIEDVESVSEFLGEVDGYFEIKINDEIKKLKIPGKNYTEVESNVILQKPKKLKKEIKDVIDVIKDKIDEKVENIKENLEEKVEYIKELVQEKVPEKVEENVEIITVVKEDVQGFFEESKATIKSIGNEVQDFIQDVKSDNVSAENSLKDGSKKSKKISKPRKVKINESKDNLDDFINLA